MKAVDPTGCGRFGDELGLYAEGEIRDRSLLGAVRSHVEACAACRDYLEDHDALTRAILAEDGEVDARWMGPFRAGLARLSGCDGDDPEIPAWGEAAAARRLERIVHAVGSLPPHHFAERASDDGSAPRPRGRALPFPALRSKPTLTAAAAFLFAAGLALAVFSPLARRPAVLLDRGVVQGVSREVLPGSPPPSPAPPALRWKLAGHPAAEPERLDLGADLTLLGFRPASAAFPRPDAAASATFPHGPAAGTAAAFSPRVPSGATVEWVVEAVVADRTGSGGDRVFLVPERDAGDASAPAPAYIEIAPRALRSGAPVPFAAGPGAAADVYRVIVVRGAPRWSAPMLIAPAPERSLHAGIRDLLGPERRVEDPSRDWVVPAGWKPPSR